LGKTLEQTIHEAELPTPAMTGEDFNSYVSRVAHAAAFIGAAWAIANGPQAQGPQPPAPGGIFDGPSADYVKQPSQDPVPDPTFDNPITVDGVPAEERWRQPDEEDHAAEHEHVHPEDSVPAQTPGSVQRSTGPDC
jgi:hypothetical protein